MTNMGHVAPHVIEENGVRAPESAIGGDGVEFRLAIWFGTPDKVPLRREGITRFFAALSQAMLHIPRTAIEIWTYACNEPDVRAAFASAVSAATQHALTIHSEINPNGRDLGSTAVNEAVKPLGPEPLVAFANRYSKADLFFVYHLHFTQALGIHRPKAVYVPDLSAVVFDEQFNREDVGNSEGARMLDSLREFSLQGALFFCNSPYVLQTHLWPRLSHAKRSRCHAVYLPVVPPPLSWTPEDTLRTRYELERPFLFYPTQDRPYKDVATLIAATAALRERGDELDVVLTASGGGASRLAKIARAHGIESHVRFLQDVNEADLYGLHRAAAATVVTTHFEGGFPWQALEAIHCGTPVVLCDLPVVRERLQSIGRADLLHHLLLFQPSDLNHLIEQIELACQDRRAVVEKQSEILTALATYSWDDVARQYRQILMTNSKRSFGLASRWWSIKERLRRRAKSLPVLRHLDELYRKVQRLETENRELQVEMQRLRQQVVDLESHTTSADHYIEQD